MYGKSDVAILTVVRVNNRFVIFYSKHTSHTLPLPFYFTSAFDDEKD